VSAVFADTSFYLPDCLVAAWNVWLNAPIRIGLLPIALPMPRGKFGQSSHEPNLCGTVLKRKSKSLATFRSGERGRLDRTCRRLADRIFPLTEISLASRGSAPSNSNGMKILVDRITGPDAKTKGQTTP
jgi:hypothetical protein